jgi:formylglycine-generating enzyme required for sulfatase activity
MSDSHNYSGIFMHKFRALLGITLMMSVSTFAIADDKIPIPEMVDIPAGSFMMGNINNFVPKDPNRVKATEFEQPVRKVDIKAFRIGKYEVTFEQYDAFAEATGKAKPDDQGNGRGQQPVGNVTWWEAVAYAEWLSQKTGKKFRLPSEAEWQYAARAGTTTEYYWGNEIDRNFANYGKDECCGLHASGADKWLGAAPVGQFPPNKFGLYDMLGNVSEIVQDCWNPNYIGAPTDGSAWTTGDCSKHVTVGGQYHFEPFWIRSAARIYHPGDDAERYINFGFRIAQGIE